MWKNAYNNVCVFLIWGYGCNIQGKIICLLTRACHSGTAQQPGIIFLTMQELFERIHDLQGDKVTEISLSYLEIYNETIRDLLLPPGQGKQNLMLREDANQAVSVAGLSSHHPQNVCIWQSAVATANHADKIKGSRSHGHDRPRKQLPYNVTHRSKCHLLPFPCRTTN